MYTHQYGTYVLFTQIEEGVIMVIWGWFLCHLIALIKPFMNMLLYIPLIFVVFDFHHFSLPYNVFTSVWAICPFHPKGIGINNGPSRLISMSSDSPYLTIYEYVPLYTTNFCSFWLTQVFVTIQCIHIRIQHHSTGSPVYRRPSYPPVNPIG